MKARLVVMLAVGLSLPAQAAQVRGTASTLLAGREDPRGGDVVSVMPLYELVALEVSKLELPKVESARLVLQGWGRLQLGDDELHDTAADLGLLYFEVREGPAVLRVGRQQILEGAGRMAMIDGLFGNVELGRGFSGQFFAGDSVNPLMRLRTGDWQYGARLAYHYERKGEVGLGYTERRHGNKLAQQELALDGFYLVGKGRLAVFAAANPQEQRLVEARLAATATPRKDVTVSVDAERVAPDLFLPRTSIFSVFAVETHDALGGDLAWAASPYYDVNLEAYALLLKAKWLGYRAALRLTTYREPSHRSLVGAEIRLLDEKKNGYVRGRLLAGLQLIDKLRVTGDVFLYQYRKRINAFPRSFVGQASLVYDLSPSMRVAATGAAGQTPFAKSEVEGMIRFAYGYETDLAREVGP